MSDDTETPTPQPARRVALTVTAYLTGHLGGVYDLQSRPDGGETWSIPEHCVDERSVTGLPPEPLTRDDWDEITGTLTGRLGAQVGGRLADEWRRIALGVQREQAARFRNRPATTLEQLAAEQGVSPIESIDDLTGPPDIPAKEMDAFLDAIHERVDPQRDEIERRLRVATDNLARVRQLAITWSAAPDGTLRREASRILHETLDGPADEPDTRGGGDD
jgi:hypothetical protein